MPAASALYRARFLEDDYSLYEFGQPEASLQTRPLDVLPISAYGWDSSLLPGSGRLIAVNRSYVCYGLRSSGCIRILGRNVPCRGLFQGHMKRVTDIKFFAEDVNLVASVSMDGRLFVWSIVGNVGGKEDFQLQQHVVLAMHFEGSWKDVYPQVCWHPHSQEILMVCMSNHIFKIDVEKAQSKASEMKLSEKASLTCSTANLIDGVSYVGQHDAEVTDLSIFTEDVLYIASACNAGMVRIWEECKASPLAELMPHDGQPVGSVFFLTCDSQPDRAALLTSDSTNNKLKLWVPPAPFSRFCTWDLVQTLEFKSYDGAFAEKPFPNRICTVSQAGLVLLGNSGSPSLYSVHLKFGSALNEVRMNYLVEFSVSMPILSFTAVIETGSSCKDVVHVFCVQTQAIQEYCLNISDCLIPQLDEPALVTSSMALLEAELKKISVCKAVDGEQEKKRLDMTAKEMAELAIGNSNSGSGFGSWVEVPNWIAAAVKRNLNIASPLASGNGAGFVKSLTEDQELLSGSADDVHASLSTLPSLSVSPNSPSTSQMLANVLLPVELNALPSGLDSESWKYDMTVVTSDSAGNSLLNASHDHQAIEQTRIEEPQMILQESRAIAGSENISDRNEGKNCFGVKVEHFKGRATIANAIIVMDEIKDGLASEKAEYDEHQEELDPPDLENASNKSNKKRTRRRRKSSGFRVNKGKYKECGEQLGLPELGRPSNSLKRKRNRRRKGLRFRVAKGKHKEHQEELALTDLESPPNNVKRKRTRRRERGNKANRGMGNLFLPQLTSQIVQTACQSPSINGVVLSDQLTAIGESVDKLLTTQMEFQKNICTMIDVPVSHEIGLIDAFREERLHDYSTSYWNTVSRQIAERSKQNVLQFEWTGQLRKAFDEFFGKDFLFIPTFILTSEVHSCIESNISMAISAIVDKGLLARMPQILESWDNHFFRYEERSLTSILNTLLSEQMESVLIGWKHLMQVEMKYFINKLY